MYIEFKLPVHYDERDSYRRNLRLELRKWCSKHNINYTTIDQVYNGDRNVERVRIPNDRALELFALSWNDQIPYVLRKG